MAKLWTARPLDGSAESCMNEPGNNRMTDVTPHNYTRNILLQILLVLGVLVIAGVWQRDLIAQIYFHNQVNAVGWLINGGILLLFVCGLFELTKRFMEYRVQEQAINRLQSNLGTGGEPLIGIPRRLMISERFLTLQELSRRREAINQNALAATLLASESSRNSFLKFVHNVLILTGVFGTIVSLSISLLGASDILQSSGQINILPGGDQESGKGLGTMIFGMSTALSTTLTAILAYLFFGYFYIKLTDTQTFLISKVEEVSATTLIPHFQSSQGEALDFSNIQSAGELIEKLGQAQERVTQKLTELLESRAAEDRGNQEMLALIREMIEVQMSTTNQNNENLNEVVTLLQRGFRLRPGGLEP